MLYPVQNDSRQLLSLDGIWKATFDPGHLGVVGNWADLGAPEVFETAVPGSLNEGATRRQDYASMDWAWYFQTFVVPSAWKGQRVFLRFGSVTKNCDVWVNGTLVGSDDDGMLPFEFEVGGLLHYGAENKLAVRLDNHLCATTIPQGGLNPGLGGVASWRPSNHPDVHYDFFPFMGIHRSVTLYTTGPIKLESCRITTLSLDQDVATVRVDARWTGQATRCKASIPELGIEWIASCDGQNLSFDKSLSGILPWSPQNPRLYRLVFELSDATGVYDEYAVDFGFRTIEVSGDQLLLNGKPLFLKGFGRHEDSPGSGRGLSLPWLAKDYGLMKWMGANSFRTSHYPYCEESLQMADRQGFLVIDESAANTLSMRAMTDPVEKSALAQNHDLHVRRLMERDWNHPSVILWSLGNECETYIPEGVGYFRDRIAKAKAFDSHRPITFVINSKAEQELEADSFDILCINAYPAWYEACGRPEEIKPRLTKLLVDFHDKYRKPVMLTEFGADCIAGMHSVNALQWSEEYQAELVEEVYATCDALPFVVGTHVWNFADFTVGQHFNRPMFNYKGLFTRERHPKMAAHLTRKRWTKLDPAK